MVDFRRLMDPQTCANLDRYIATRDKVMELDHTAFVARVIHNLHNCSTSEYSRGEFVYDAERDHVLVPEMLRRLCGGAIPRKCPVCGADPDWDHALVASAEGELL